MPRLTQDQILAELRATFSTIAIEVTATDDGVRQIRIGPGGGHPVMPDGHAIFNVGESDSARYYAGLHEEFVRWAVARGWFPEPTGDGFWLLTPAPSAEQAAADRRAFLDWLRARCRDVDDFAFADWVEGAQYARPAGVAGDELRRRLEREVFTYIQETQA